MLTHDLNSTIRETGRKHIYASCHISIVYKGNIIFLVDFAPEWQKLILCLCIYTNLGTYYYNLHYILERLCIVISESWYIARLSGADMLLVCLTYEKLATAPMLHL